MISEDLNVWMLEKSFRSKWKNPFRIYGRMRAESFANSKCFGLCMILAIILSILNIVSSVFIFPDFFGVGGEKSSFLFDAILFLIVFIINAIAIQQSKGADEALHNEYKRDRRGLILLLAIYGTITITFGYTTFMASMFMAFCIGLGFMGAICEMNFKRSALRERKTQIDRFQDLRELIKYLKKEILLIEQASDDKKKNYEPLLKQYKAVLDKARLEYAYLEGVLK